MRITCNKRGQKIIGSSTSLKGKNEEKYKKSLSGKVRVGSEGTFFLSPLFCLLKKKMIGDIGWDPNFNLEAAIKSSIR